MVQMPSLGGASCTESTPSSAATPADLPPAPMVASGSAYVGHELDPLVTTYSRPSTGSPGDADRRVGVSLQARGQAAPGVAGRESPCRRPHRLVVWLRPHLRRRPMGWGWPCRCPRGWDGGRASRARRDPPTSDCAQPDSASAAVMLMPRAATPARARVRAVTPDRSIRLIFMPRSFHSPLKSTRWRGRRIATPPPLSCGGGATVLHPTDDPYRSGDRQSELPVT